MVIGSYLLHVVHSPLFESIVPPSELGSPVSSGGVPSVTPLHSQTCVLRQMAPNRQRVYGLELVVEKDGKKRVPTACLQNDLFPRVLALGYLSGEP